MSGFDPGVLVLLIKIIYAGKITLTKYSTKILYIALFSFSRSKISL